MHKKKIQIGITAQRDSDGNFLEEKPIYRNIEVDKSGLSNIEQENLTRFAQFLAEKYHKGKETENAKV